jgi:tRNA U34 2-thiouridine synthase MnmA/TrmU
VLFRSEEEIVSQASKYKSMLELRKKDTKLYWLIKNNKLENSAFPKKSKWTKEKIREESNNYKTRSEFAKKSQGAYVVAKGLKMLDELFPIS